MFETDGEIKFQALTMWANHIETGDVSMSPQDAVNRKLKDKIKPLTLQQQELVVRIKKLAQKELKNG